MLQKETKELLSFLNKNPTVRAQVRAAPDKTLLYAGHFFRPIWKEIEEERRALGLIYKKTILPDVLCQIRLQDAPYSNFLEWVQSIDNLYPDDEWLKNGYIAWRALSGIFASNAQGAVSFMIGGGVSKDENKVFASTEIHVLDRNPKIDAVTKDAVHYYLRCVRSKQSNINTGLIHG